jgi:hypothetical protein
VTVIYTPVTAEALVHFPAVPAADLVHLPGVSMLPSYPAGAVRGDASLEQDVCTALHTLAPYAGAPNSHHSGFSTGIPFEHIVYLHSL